VKIFRLGSSGEGRRAPNVNLGHPIISETTRARKMNLKIPLDMAKYPFWVQKLLHYTIQLQHVGGRHLTFDKCLYFRGRLWITTARRLSAYMSSRALATTTTSSSIFNWLRVINTAGRPKCCRISGASFKIHHLSHITYRIKRIKISFCILSINLITIA